MEIDEKEIDANIENLIPALLKDVERFIRLRGEKVVPTFLYVDRKDDVWDVCFCEGQDEGLEFFMTRWTSGVEQLRKEQEMTVYNHVDAYRHVTTKIHEAVMGGDSTWNNSDMAEKAVLEFLINPVGDSDGEDTLVPGFNFPELVCDVRMWMIWFLSNQENLPSIELIRLYGVDRAATPDIEAAVKTITPEMAKEYLGVEIDAGGMIVNGVHRAAATKTLKGGDPE